MHLYFSEKQAPPLYKTLSHAKKLQDSIMELNHVIFQFFNSFSNLRLYASNILEFQVIIQTYYL